MSKPVFSGWHYELFEALAAGDRAKARQVYEAAEASPGYIHPDHPIDRALRLLVACLTGDRSRLAEAEASLAQNADLEMVQFARDDGRLAAYLLAGLLRLTDDRALAAAHFEAALRLRPAFLPARVELECLRRGVDRETLFKALGEDVPRMDWRYLLAASELGLDAGIQPVATRGAICIRGLCTPHTPALVRLYRWLNPGVPIFLATWRDTPPEILQQIQGLATVGVMGDLEKPGSQNKNRQIALATGTLTMAREQQVEEVLLVRTDIALFAPNIVPTLHALQAAFPVRSDKMKGRLVVSDLFTRRFRYYHVSDIMCFGAFEDVARYWAAPYQEDDGMVSTETYLGMNLLSQVSPDAMQGDAYEAFLKLLADCFIVRDLDWFDGFWMRHPRMANGAGLTYGDACVSQKDWEQLYFAPDALKRDLFMEANLVTREILSGAAKGAL